MLSLLGAPFLPQLNSSLTPGFSLWNPTKQEDSQLHCLTGGQLSPSPQALMRFLFVPDQGKWACPTVQATLSLVPYQSCQQHGTHGFTVHQSLLWPFNRAASGSRNSLALSFAAWTLPHPHTFWTRFACTPNLESTSVISVHLIVPLIFFPPK